MQYIDSLVCQFILLRAEAWKYGAIAVAALDSYLVNLKFRFCVFHSFANFLQYDN